MIDDSMEESMCIAALVISYHQINKAWPTSHEQLYNFFSNIDVNHDVSETKKAIDNGLYYIREIQPLEFMTNSDERFVLSYKNYKNRDVWVYISYIDSDENRYDKEYSFSAKIQIPSNAGKISKQTSIKSQLSKEKYDYMITLIGYILEGLRYVPYTTLP